jgi:hypothetical protein
MVQPRRELAVRYYACFRVGEAEENRWQIVQWHGNLTEASLDFDREVRRVGIEQVRLNCEETWLEERPRRRVRRIP